MRKLRNYDILKETETYISYWWQNGIMTVSRDPVTGLRNPAGREQWMTISQMVALRNQIWPDSPVNYEQVAAEYGITVIIEEKKND